MTLSTNSNQTYTLDTLPTYTFTTPNDHTYHYIYIPPSTSSAPSSSSQTSPKSTILFLHGFPSVPHDFHRQIQTLTTHGHGILAPFLLGYHPTSSPKSLSSYRLKSVSADIISILDHLDPESPVPAIGHDWGVTLLSRLEYYHPTRFSKLAYLTIAPTPFGGSFNLDKVNDMTRQMLGYEGFGYQKFFMDDFEGAAESLQQRHERMERLMFAEDSTGLWKDYFGRLGGLERWLKEDSDGKDGVRQIQGVSERLLRKRRQTFAPEEQSAGQSEDFGPGYRGPLMWYVALNGDVNLEDEQKERSNWETYRTDKPVLMVLSGKDPIALPDMQAGMVEKYVQDQKQLRVEMLACGHFVMLEKVDELAVILLDFFKEV